MYACALLIDIKGAFMIRAGRLACITPKELQAFFRSASELPQEAERVRLIQQVRSSPTKSGCCTSIAGAAPAVCQRYGKVFRWRQRAEPVVFLRFALINQLYDRNPRCGVPAARAHMLLDVVGVAAASPAEHVRLVVPQAKGACALAAHPHGVGAC
jgi:hypothetical protein